MSNLFQALETILTKKNVMEGSGVQNLEPFIIQRYLSFIQNRGIILILNNFFSFHPNTINSNIDIPHTIDMIKSLVKNEKQL